VAFGDGSQQYDFIHVSDVARANVLAMEADASEKCYNVGRGIGTSIRELAELLLRLTGSDLPIQYRDAGLTFVTNRIGCPKLAERDLGFRWKIDLEEGMRSLIEWRNADREGLAARQMAVAGA
jgi:UDP-glucose 4-epimerase